MTEKTPLIILHGALGAKNQFSPLIEHLSSKFEVHTLNFSGHGGLPFAQDFSIDRFKEELKIYIEDNSLKGVNIFGYSMGGYVALSLAAQHSDYIGKIFTLGTKFDWTPASAEQEVKMLNPDKIEGKVPAFAKALSDRHAPNDWKKVLLKTKELMLELGNGKAIDEATFRKINTPTLIGIGDQDNMVSHEESQKVADALPQGTLKVFKGFKHPIEQVDIKILAEEIQQFY